MSPHPSKAAICGVCGALRAEKWGRCPSCGLDWHYPRYDEGVEVAGRPPAPEKPFKFVLRVHRDGFWFFAALMCAVMIAGGLIACLIGLSGLWRPGVSVKAVALGELLFGAWVVYRVGISVLVEMLPVVWPSRVEFDGGTLRLKAWGSSDEIWSGLRRCDAAIPLEDVRGVGVHLYNNESFTYVSLLHKGGGEAYVGHVGQMASASAQARALEKLLGYGDGDAGPMPR